MKTTYLVLAAMTAGLAYSGAAAEPRQNARIDARADSRIELAQYYERRGGYDDGYGGGYGGGGGYRYCRNWAQAMVAIGMEAARKGCLQYGPQGLHTHFDAHMNFCLSASVGRTQRAAARANQLLYACDR